MARTNCTQNVLLTCRVL